MKYYLIILISFLLLSSCGEHKCKPGIRPFISMKKEYKIFIPKNYGKGFVEAAERLNGIGLSYTDTCIKGQIYYFLNKDLRANDSSIFRLKGYIRQSNDIVFMRTEDYNKEQILFNFKDKPDAERNLQYSDNKKNFDIINYVGKIYNKILRDTAFVYDIENNLIQNNAVSDSSPSSHILVSKKQGIVAISIGSFITTVTIYYAPKDTVIFLAKPK